jgi:serine/threonine-protein kinase
LAREPVLRYPNAAALAEDLRRFRTEDVLFVDNLDEPPQQERWARRAGYEILELLGASTQGFSYKARHLTLDRVAVLKRMSVEYRFVPAAKSRFRREAYILAGLHHPQFVQVLDHGEQNDLAYFAREFVDGPTLSERAAKTPFTATQACEIAALLADAMHALHAHGMMHGGLTPAHVRLTPAGIPKITRFRRAWVPLIESSPERLESKFHREAGYLAPEHLERSHRALTPATDIYSLGAILYLLLTGRPVFQGPTLAETLKQVQMQSPVSPCSLRPDVPLELDALCLSCLDKTPSRRPRSAQDVADSLREITF